MLNNTTIDKLKNMRLSAMAEAYRNQMITPSFEDMSFDERLGLLVDIEWTRRKNNHLQKLIRDANFNQSYACIENIEYRPDRKLNKDLIHRLGSCNYIQETHNIIVMGASGNGKTYLACAFGMAACRNFYTVKYIRLPELLNELAVARGEGIFKKTVAQYKKVGLLILDEWLLVSLKESEARDLLEIIEARHHKASTIFCTQFDPVGWHEKVGEDTLADAILDRIVHDSYNIFIEGQDSMRKLKGIKE
jgi:DNA replication protein DnaC